MAVKQKRIFLSHTSKDKPLADKLADLLTNGCDVSPNDILCTSLEGKGIPAGTSSFIDFLRGQIQKPDMVILLLSENFFASHFCMCELGAVWGMGLPFFPLVVPPADKGKLKAVLAVAQAGDIVDAGWLDELRDMVKERLGTAVPTATWTVKRDAFLGSIGRVLKSLPGLTLVPSEKLKAVEDQYQAALVEVEAKEDQIVALKLENSELRKCKDADEVKEVTRKYQDTSQQFHALRKAVAAALTNLRTATAAALYANQRGVAYFPKDEGEWDDANEALERQEICQVESDCCEANLDHPRVATAQKSLVELRRFLKNLEVEDYEFLKDFEDTNQFPADMANKEFWQTFLAGI